MGRGGVAQPKPEPIKRTKARTQREDAKQLSAFRQAVWMREMVKHWGTVCGELWALCQGCQAIVSPGIEFYMVGTVGEVHHRIGRRNKATRYDPANGVLLCKSCHGKVQRHEMECL